MMSFAVLYKWGKSPQDQRNVHVVAEGRLAHHIMHVRPTFGVTVAFTDMKVG